jgi:hypothetical protein
MSILLAPYRRTWRFGEVTVCADYRSGMTVTRWADGLELPAVPHETDEYRARAEALGYGTGDYAAGAMCREHEFLHSAVAERLLGLPSCPVLRRAAEGDPMSPEEAWPVEAVILHLQASLNRPLSGQPAMVRRFVEWARRRLRE